MMIRTIPPFNFILFYEGKKKWNFCCLLSFFSVDTNKGWDFRDDCTELIEIYFLHPFFPTFENKLVIKLFSKPLQTSLY